MAGSFLRNPFRNVKMEKAHQLPQNIFNILNVRVWYSQKYDQYVYVYIYIFFIIILMDDGTDDRPTKNIDMAPDLSEARMETLQQIIFSISIS